MTVSELADQKCVPCSGGTPALKGEHLQAIHRKLGDQWQVVKEHHLTRNFDFEDFAQALEFTNQVGNLAERTQHHPDIYLTYGQVKVTLYTHKIDGLTDSDFVMAAKIDELPRP